MLKIILLAGILVLLPCGVQGGTIDIAYSGLGATVTVTVWSGGRNGFNTYAGSYMVNKTGGTGEGELWADGLLGVFRIELSEVVSTNPKTYDVVFPEYAQNPTTFLGGVIGETKVDYLRELWGRYYDSSWVLGGTYTPEQKRTAGAFSTAMWEIIYEAVSASPSQGMSPKMELRESSASMLLA